jgi:uncharacterized protein (DUF1697 family)
MTRHVCLLRAVNVGGNNRLAMPALRDLFEELGYGDVTTYIQSGNVVFSAARRPDPGHLEAAIERAFALPVTVVLRTATQLAELSAANPFADRSPDALHVGFLPSAPSTALRSELDPDACPPDRFAVAGAEVFLFLPGGMGRSKVPAYLARRLGPATYRNWRTVRTLTEMAAG